MTSLAREKQRQQLARDFERDSKDYKGLNTDASIMKLPHPLRTQSNPMYQAKYMVGAIAGVENEQLMRDLFIQGYGNNHIFFALDNAGSTNFMQFIAANSSGHDGGYNGGSTGATFHLLRYQITAGRLFTIDDPLVELLAQTDIDLDIPTSDIRLPYPNIYVELGRDRNLKSMEPLALYNRVSGLHAFEGAYVSQTYTGEERRPTIEITMTGSPMGHSEIGDDAVEWISMDLSKPRTVFEAMSDSFDRGTIIGSTNSEPGTATGGNPDFKARNLPDMGRRLEMVLKALLYISMPDLREQLITERTQANKVLLRSQSGSHKRKALRQMMRARDAILIMAPTSADSQGPHDESDQDEAHIATHWRRGHFRRQRHGPALANTKVIWISPRLVNAAHLDQLTTISGKNYIAR